MTARFPAGTFARMREVLGAGESKSDLLREAFEAKLTRREAERRRASAIAAVAGWIA